MPMSGREFMVQEQRVMELKDRVNRGDYRVDPIKVAEAILQRVLRRAGAQSAQSECAYPASPGGPSANTSPGGASSTRPTHVTDGNGVWRGLGGMQTQSS